MPIAIETLIIIIVIVSLTIVGSLTFALYWLWKLLIEDRRWSRLQNCNWPGPAPPPCPNYAPVPASSPVVSHRSSSYVPLPTSFVVPDDSETVVTFPDDTAVAVVIPPILTVALSDDEPPKPPPRSITLEVESPPALMENPTIVAEMIQVEEEVFRRLATDALPEIDVIVLDDSEPPPPYEEHK